MSRTKLIRFAAVAITLALASLLSTPKQAHATEPCTCEEEWGFAGDAEAYCGQFSNPPEMYSCSDFIGCDKWWNGVFWEFHYSTSCYEQSSQCTQMMNYCEH